MRNRSIRGYVVRAPMNVTIASKGMVQVNGIWECY
jgi:hypothetical protein